MLHGNTVCRRRRKEDVKGEKIFKERSVSGGLAPASPTKTSMLSHVAIICKHVLTCEIHSQACLNDRNTTQVQVQDLNTPWRAVTQTSFIEYSMLSIIEYTWHRVESNCKSLHLCWIFRQYLHLQPQSGHRLGLIPSA